MDTLPGPFQSAVCRVEKESKHFQELAPIRRHQVVEGIVVTKDQPRRHKSAIHRSAVRLFCFVFANNTYNTHKTLLTHLPCVCLVKVVLTFFCLLKWCARQLQIDKIVWAKTLFSWEVPHLDLESLKSLSITFIISYPSSTGP